MADAGVGGGSLANCASNAGVGTVPDGRCTGAQPRSPWFQYVAPARVFARASDRGRGRAWLLIEGKTVEVRERRHPVWGSVCREQGKSCTTWRSIASHKPPLHHPRGCTHSQSFGWANISTDNVKRWHLRLRLDASPLDRAYSASFPSSIRSSGLAFARPRFDVLDRAHVRSHAQIPSCSQRCACACARRSSSSRRFLHSCSSPCPCRVAVVGALACARVRDGAGMQSSFCSCSCRCYRARTRWLYTAR